MEKIHKNHKGDITLLTIFIIIIIMLTLFVSLSQKSVFESRLSRENLYSQEAIQAANTALSAWEYQYVSGAPGIPSSVVVDPLSSNKNNRDHPASSNNGATKNWINLNTGSNSVQYRAEYIGTVGDPNDPPTIIGIGRVNKGGIVTERALAQQVIPTTPTP
jgi:Tfp pilus assembly protein PilX